MKNRDDETTCNSHHSKQLGCDAVRWLGDPNIDIILWNLKADWIVGALKSFSGKADGLNQIRDRLLANVCIGPSNLIVGVHVWTSPQGTNAMSIHVSPQFLVGHSFPWHRQY